MAEFNREDRPSDDLIADIEEEARQEVLELFRTHLAELEEYLMQSRKALGRLETGLADLYQTLNKWKGER